MTSRLKLNSVIPPFLFIGMAILQLLDPSEVWKALLTAFGGAWLVSWLWARSLKSNLQVTREIRFAWAQVGDKLEENFTLKNNGPLPATWVEVQDHSTMPNYSASRATSADGNESNSWRTSGVCTRRGVYQLGGTTLRSSDPFGLYSIEIHHPEHQTLLVMPPIVPLPMIEISPAGWTGEGRPRPNMPEQIISAVTIREYQQGESFKQIHWPTTARRQKLFTRVLDGTPANDWWIVLDADTSVQAGQNNENTLELGVITAASLLDRGLHAHHSVGLLANGQKTSWLKPQAGEKHRFHMMQELAMLEAGHQPLAELLERASPIFGQHTSLVIITPSLNSDWLTPLLRLMWKGIRPTVILIDPASFGAHKNNADALAGVLSQMGIARFILTRDLLQHPEARPGWQGQWEWRIMATGKAIASRPMGDMTWKKLG